MASKVGSLLLLATTAFATPSINGRALPNAPNGYTPVAGDCPSQKPALRLANGLSQNETSWVQTRRNVTVAPMTELLGSLNISGFDAASYIKDQAGNITNLPNIAIAASGGGYRAMLTGGGALKAYDSRETNTPGGLGGLLQSATYVAGLSGGGWLVGSVYTNNFTRISDLQSGVGDLWNLTQTIFDAPVGFDELSYFDTLGTEVMGKEKAGYDVSITDYWGRTLSFQFINATDGGPSYTWSSIRDQPGFSTGEIPFPLIVADNRVNNETSFPPTNTTVFEFGPFEMGSWDPTTYGFVDLQYIGSNFSNGKLADNAQCVRGYDNAGFLIGTTSSIFTSLAGPLLQSEIPQSVQGDLGNVINETVQDQGFVAYYEPNPFLDWNPTGNAVDSGSNTLYLVDGGTDDENIPFQPLIQPARAVDVIVALDNSNDVIGFPNGTAMVATYARSQASIANGTAFPKVPDQNTFVNLGLNQRPTFFGCNDTNTPLIVYMPNAPYTTASNTSTFQLTYNYTQRDALISNGELVATRGNGTGNAEFRACLGCAILARSFARTKTNIPDACQTCFNAYCWNGTTASENPSTPYSPSLIGASPAGMNLNVVGSSNSSNSSGSGSGSSGSGSGSGSGSSGGSGNGHSGASKSLQSSAFAVLLAVVIGITLS